MTEAELADLVEKTCIALLDAADADERARIVDGIVLNRRVAATVIMLLSEEVAPVMPPPVAATGVLQ